MRLRAQQAVLDGDADVQRPAARAVGLERHAPLTVGEAPRGARQGFEIGVDYVNGGHRTHCTVARMRAIAQRVRSAHVDVGGERVAQIGAGLLVLLGVRRGDGADQAERMARKLAALRVFDDADGRMNLSVTDVGGEVLCVSQFTLYGDTSRGNRPGYADAAPPEEAEPLYELVRERLGAGGGRFGAHMEVSLVNDGPVTLVVET
jgi:D-aminoacyl-tRNA deacylase